MTTLIPKYDVMNGGSTPTGAINRAINLKLSDLISVKDFGATGDGTTDDSTAINAALTYAATFTGGACVYFPPTSAKYKCNSGLSINTNNVMVNFGGCSLDFTGLTTGNAITIVRTQTDANIANAQDFAHTISNGVLYGPSGANTSTIAVYFNDATSPNTLSGTCFDSMSFINFGQDVYFGSGAFCNEFRHCNFTIYTGTPTTYSITSPAGTNNGERISFTGCMWNNRDLVLNHTNVNGSMQFINCSFDYSATRIMTVTGGVVFIANSHIEQNSDSNYWFSCTGTNSIINVSDTDLIIQSTKTAYEPFYSDSTCTTGGISLENIRVLGSATTFGLIGGTGKTVVRNMMSPIVFGLPLVSSYLNSLAYGGFESANYTAEWTLSAGATRSSAQAKSGTYSLSFPATSSQTPIAYATIPCIAGQSFTASLYYLLPAITGTGGTFSISYVYQDKGGNSLSTGGFSYTANVASWTKLNIAPQVLTPTGTVSVKLNITLFGVTTGTPTGYIDDVILNVV